MNDMLKERLEELALALLDDDHGVGERAYQLLREMLDEVGSDIPKRVDATDGRFYIPNR